MISFKLFILLFVTIVCVISSIIHIVISQQPVVHVNATLQVFTNLPELAQKLPHLDPFIDELSIMIEAVNDTYDELPKSMRCRPEIEQLLNSMSTTLETLHETMTYLGIKTSHTVNQFMRINSALMNNPSTIYKLGLYRIKRELEQLLHISQHAIARYRLLDALVGNPSDICADIPEQKIWFWLYGRQLSRKDIDNEMVFKRFIAAQSNRRVVLGQMQTAMNEYREMVKHVYNEAKHSIVDMPDDLSTLFIDHTIRRLDDIFRYLVTI